jgi:splicing factor U2AF subunit
VRSSYRRDFYQRVSSSNFHFDFILLGLHYHLNEEQVSELLQAFGKVKAFHLVKSEPDSLTSKGYCFVEYADPNVTQVAVIGLNGMDLGGGKVLTARVAGEKTGPSFSQLEPESETTQEIIAPRPDALIISGYDIEVLVDAAMGLRSMPTLPMHVDQFGMPVTRTTGLLPLTAPAALPPPVVGAPALSPLPPGSSALDIANAALNAAFGGNGGPPPAAPPATPQPTRILVLLNMVSDEDLATDEEYHGLLDEVQEEGAKFGRLLGMNVPRRPSATVEPSAVKKIFLEYATLQDASNAERELAGRQFGPNVVQVRNRRLGSMKS